MVTPTGIFLQMVSTPVIVIRAGKKFQSLSLDGNSFALPLFTFFIYFCLNNAAFIITTKRGLTFMLCLTCSVYRNRYQFLIDLGAWGRTSLGFSLPREYGRSCPPESGVAPLASASNPTATPVRIATKGRWSSLAVSAFHLREGTSKRLSPSGDGLQTWLDNKFINEPWENKLAASRSYTDAKRQIKGLCEPAHG